MKSSAAPAITTQNIIPVPKPAIANRHIVLDLETLGTRPGAIILTIGAALLTRAGVEDTYYRVIDPASCVTAGLKCDISTIKWWMRQDQAAQDHALDEDAAVSLDTALTEFAHWLPLSGDYHLWGNGADFDNAILENAYHATDSTVPWKYYQNRCFRTLRALHPEIEAPEWPEGNIKHHSLHDALHEAEHLYEILVESYNY